VWAQGTSLAPTGHDLTTAKRHGKREPASTRSRSSIGTSTPPPPIRFRNRL